jgi:broad specificity phosphatase PhoE
LAVCPGGEGLLDAADRILIAIEAIARQHPGQSVAAVTHAAIVRLAVAKITGRLGPGWRIPLPTGGITVIEAAGGALSVPLRDNAANWILDLRGLENRPAASTRSG